MGAELRLAANGFLKQHILEEDVVAKLLQSVIDIPPAPGITIGHTRIHTRLHTRIHKHHLHSHIHTLVWVCLVCA